MKKIELKLDYNAGPIWKEFMDPYTFEKWTGIEVIDNDSVVRELDEKICDMYTSYYEFDSHNQACWFNEEQEKKDKDILLDLLQKLINRLNEINDGSFELDDKITSVIEAL